MSFPVSPFSPFYPVNNIQLHGSGGKVLANNGKIVNGPNSGNCCCIPECNHCGGDSRDVPKGYTVTLAGWQMPTCWGPKLAFSNYWSVGITHEGGEMNGTFDVPARHYNRPHPLGGIDRICHYVSDPIPLKLQWYIYPDIEEPYDGPNCGIKMEQWHNDYFQIVIARLFQLTVVAQGGSTSQGSLNPFQFFDQTAPKCSEPLYFEGPYEQRQPSSTWETDGADDNGIWGGTVTAVPYY